MAERLRFQTAANIKMGPFVDREDGASPETGLSISLSNVQVSKNGGAFAQKHQSSTPTHDVDGWYLVALDTGDTDTLGRLTVKIHDSGALPVWRHLEIVPQPVYDAEVLGTGNLQVETVAFSDTGVNNRLSRIQAEVDTGIRAHVSDVDTGIHDTIADLDTGLRAHITASAGGTPPDTGAIASAVWTFTTRTLTAFNHDTGVSHTVWSAANRTVTNVTGFSDTGVNDRLARILADTDTGLKDEIATLDTGLRALISASAGGDAPDTGEIASAVWGFATRVLTSGANIALAKGVGVTGFNDLSQADVRTAVGLASANLDSQLAAQDTGAVSSAVWSFANRTVTNVTGFSDTGVNDRLSKIGGDADTGLRDAISDARYVDTGPTADLAVLSAGVNVASIRSDTGAASRLQKLAGNQLKEDGTFDTGTGQVTNTFNVQANVTLDTGTPINVQVDIPAIAAGVWSAGSRTLTDIDTGVITSGVWSASTRTLTSFSHDTGVAHTVWSSATRTLTNYHDTGIDQDLTRIISRVAEADTGIRGAIADIDTGLRDAISDIGGSVDTGSIVDAVWGAQRSAHADTGTFGEHLGGDLGGGMASVDTGVIANAVWGKDVRTLTSFQFDTGVAHTVWGAATRTLTSINDTGLNQRLDVIRSDTDTGLRSAILASAYVDTGPSADLAALRSGVNVTSFADTGVNSRLTRIQAEADTGLRSAIQSAAYSDTGPSAALTRIESKLSEVDTGLRDALADLDTGLRDYITDTVPSSDITAIKAQTDKLTFDTGNEILADIRKVNNVTVTGTGDTGAGDTWRPA